MISRKLQDEAVRGTQPFDVYLDHELSHSLTYQNVSLLSLLAFPARLDEAIAVHCANQFGAGGCFSKHEVCEHMRQGYFFHPEWWTHSWKKSSDQLKQFPLKDKYYFIYSEFGCIVDDLIDTYGRERFQTYYHRLLKEKDHEEVFQSTFGLPFPEYLDDFRSRGLQETQSQVYEEGQ